MDVQNNILVAGAGKIGSVLTALLSTLDNTHVILIDNNTTTLPDFLDNNTCITFYPYDSNNTQTLSEVIKKHSIQAIISCLPYFLNFSIAETAKKNHCHYFDLTEDVETTRRIFSLAQHATTAFVPQCGVAPGLINIIASSLIQPCDTVNAAKLYCGSLPQKSNLIMKYALLWSIEGLINEYANPCQMIEKGKIISAPGLSGLEKIILNNEAFEAFNTSGGIGTLIDTYQNKAHNMYYKTLRYPGHYEKIKFLMEELNLTADRDTLKKILENALPTTNHDFVITHVHVEGISNHQSVVLTDTRYFYPTKIADIPCTAIQAVTSISAIAVIHAVLSSPEHYHGPIKQENFDLESILRHPLTQYLRGQYGENP